MISNKKMGNSFETELCNLLAEHGYWCHNMIQSAAGQPADIIAVANGMAFLIDCKVCKNDRFPFSRIEPNQVSAMKYWLDCGNRAWSTLFALKTSKGIYMMQLNTIQYLQALNINNLGLKEIEKYGLRLNKWYSV